MTGVELTSVVVIVFAAALAPLVADRLSRWLTIPTTVLEIGFGILIGPAVFGLARTGTVVDALASFGLAVLFFLAGYEVDFPRIRGSPLRRAFGSWVGSVLLGLAVGALLAAVVGGGVKGALVLGLALATTALGTILPIVRDTGVLKTPLGAKIMAVGAVGEFAPVVMVTVLLSGDRPLRATGLLVAFVAVAMVAAAVAMRKPPERMTQLLTKTLGTSAQFAVRLSILVVVTMTWLATELHVDLVLGAFAAGVVIRLMLASISRQEAKLVESKLEGIGYGMLIPFFFVTTGVRFDLSALLGSASALALVPVGLAAFLLVRGVPVALAFRHEPGAHRRALELYAATALPLVVVITSIGVEAGWVSSATAAGLVGAAMVSVMLFPALARSGTIRAVRSYA